MIEAAFGQGEAVVSGAVEPDLYAVTREGSATSSRRTSAGRRSRSSPTAVRRNADRSIRTANGRGAHGRRGARGRGRGPRRRGALRHAPGCRVVLRPRGGSAPRAGPADHDDRRRRPTFPRRTRAACWSPAWCQPGHRDREGPSARQPGGGRVAAGRGDPRRHDDRSRLAAHPAAGGGRGHGAGRHDLPRGDREPRAGIPCVVGARAATVVLRRRAAHLGGRQSRAACTSAAHAPAADGEGAPFRRRSPPGPPVTATKLYVNLAIPERAAAVAELAVDGVGLLRAEMMLTDALERRHPRACSPTGGRRGVPRPR